MKSRTLLDRFYRLRANHRRNMRLIFASPAEMQLIKIMGGVVVSLPLVRAPKTKFPVSIVLFRGWTFKLHGIKREVRCSKYFVDFCNSKGYGIEVDGAAYHTDFNADMIRDKVLYAQGVSILRIKGVDIYRDPKEVKKRVKKYLKNKHYTL